MLSPQPEIEAAVIQAIAISGLDVLERTQNHVGAEDHAQAIGIDHAGSQPRLDASHIGGADAELNVARHDLQAFARLDVLFRVEARHFGTKRQGHVPRIDRERPHAPLALHEGRPKGVDADPNRADDPQACNDNVSRHHRSTPTGSGQPIRDFLSAGPPNCMARPYSLNRAERRREGVRLDKPEKNRPASPPGGQAKS